MSGEIFPELILLCGGRSSRLGEPKGLVSVEGRPWLAHQLEGAARAGVRRAVVVLGFWSERYLAERAAWSSASAHELDVDLDVVVNPAPERGAFSSLVCGAARVNGSAFVLPIDVPSPNPDVWRALAQAPGEIVVPTFADRGGHPIRASAEFLRSLLPPAPEPTGYYEAADSRLDARIRALAPSLVTRVAVSDARVTLNLNTREQWRASAAPL